MPYIGAGGVMGIALETVSGTYEAPTKFVPFNSESLKYEGEPQEHRPIRNTAGVSDVTAGNMSVGGDVEFPVLADILIYFLMVARLSFTKSGTTQYTYLFKPTAAAVPTKTMSITVKRGNDVFGYTGCVVSSYTFTVGDDGKLVFKASIVGANEASQTAPTPTWPTSTSFGAGMYKIEVPTATQVFDTDTFEFSVEDNAEPQFRLKNSAGAQFVKFGEQSASASMERDFENRTLYDAFKALTKTSITFTATKGASLDTVTCRMGVAYQKTHEVNLSSQGDLVRSSIEYGAVNDATGIMFDITVMTTENVV